MKEKIFYAIERYKFARLVGFPFTACIKAFFFGKTKVKKF